MRNRKLILNVAVLLVVALMIAAAEISGNKEIIFPEITAVAVGALIAPKQPWNTSAVRLLITISAMALCGVLIVRYIPLSRAFTLPIGFLCALVSLVISKTSFVPQISACVLPIVLGTETIVYPISVIVMTGIILLMQNAAVDMGIYEKREYVPEAYNARRYKFLIHQLIIVTIFFEIAVAVKQLYFVVPPLVVGYMEAVQPVSSIRKRPFAAIGIIACSGLVSTLARLLLAEALGVPLTVCAVVSVTVFLILADRLKLYFPPSGAICTLPMLIGADNLWWYPVETTVGFACMMGTAILYNRFVNDT